MLNFELQLVFFRLIPSTHHTFHFSEKNVVKPSQIREECPQLQCRRLRLIHAGWLLADKTQLASWLGTLEVHQQRATTKARTNPTHLCTAWLHSPHAGTSAITLLRWRPTLRGRGRWQDTDPGAPARFMFPLPPISVLTHTSHAPCPLHVLLTVPLAP